MDKNAKKGRLLKVYEILKTTDEFNSLTTNQIIERLKEDNINCVRKTLGYHCPKQKQATTTFYNYLNDRFKSGKKTSWCAFWEQQINVNDVPNFKHPNESYFDLFDDEVFDKYTTQVANRLKELLESK